MQVRRYCKTIFTGSIRAAQTPVTRREGRDDSEGFFAPQGRHFVPMAVKSGAKESTVTFFEFLKVGYTMYILLLRAKFTTSVCNGGDVGPQKTENFYAFWNINGDT